MRTIERVGTAESIVTLHKGRDVLEGSLGNDTLNARDGVRDVVNCGPGRRDVAIVDYYDRVLGCERVLRSPKPRGARTRA